MTTPPGPDDVPTLVQRPAQAPPATLELPVASLRRRVLAELVDGMIVTTVAAACVAPIWIARGSFGDDPGIFGAPSDAASTGSMLATALAGLISTVVFVLYAALFTRRRGAWNGQTPGRRAAEVRIAMADGTALTPRAAWARAGWYAALVSAPLVVGAAIDAAAGTSPTAYRIGLILTAVLALLVLGAALVGTRRLSLHDRLAGTMVLRTRPADYPIGAPLPAAADGSPLPAVMTPRRVGAGTYALAALPIVLSAIGLWGITALEDFVPSEEEFRAIIAEPEHAAALDDVRATESVLIACLRRPGGYAGVCQPEEVDGVELAPTFDPSADEVGANAGTVGVVADGDELWIYGFTSVDRVWWSEVTADGDTTHGCFERESQICDGVGVHEW